LLGSTISTHAMSIIAKFNEEERGPALRFENVKGYSTSVITGVCTN